MSLLRQLLHEKKFVLLTYLLDDSAPFARLAETAGADALISRGDEYVAEIASAVKIPVGIEYTGLQQIRSKHFESIKKHIDFITFAPAILASMPKLNHLTKILALNEHFSLEELMRLKDQGADALDAAVLSGHLGKKELMVGDLQQYITICISSGLPVIVPTQRMIKPSEVAIIEDAGAKGILLTETVLGKTERSFEKAIQEFRIAVDDLG